MSGSHRSHSFAFVYPTNGAIMNTDLLTVTLPTTTCAPRQEVAPFIGRSRAYSSNDGGWPVTSTVILRIMGKQMGVELELSLE